MRSSFSKIGAGICWALGSALGAIACSSSSGTTPGAVLNPLDDSQRSQLRSQMSSVGQVISLANDLQNEARNGTSAAPLSGASGSNLVRSPNKSVLTALVDSGVCQKLLLLPEDGTQMHAGDLTVGTFDVDVSGESCPIQYHVSLQGRNTANGFVGQYQMTYKAMNAKGRAALDIDHFEFSGSFNGTSDSSDPSQSFALSILFNGSGHSTVAGDFKYGQKTDDHITVVVSGTDVKFGGDEHEAIEFDNSGFAARLERSVTLGDTPATDNKINNQSVSDEEYHDLRDLLDMPEFSGATDAHVPASSAAQHAVGDIQCELSVYSRAELTSADAQAFVGRGVAPAVPLLGSSHVCGASQVEIELGEQKLRVALDRTDSAALLDFSVCDSVAHGSCVRADRGFQTHANRSMTETVDLFAVTMACEPVASCD